MNVTPLRIAKGVPVKRARDNARLGSFGLLVDNHVGDDVHVCGVVHHHLVAHHHVLLHSRLSVSGLHWHAWLRHAWLHRLLVLLLGYHSHLLLSLDQEVDHLFIFENPALSTNV